MPRPKTTPIDRLRAKTWAVSCAKAASKNSERASTYELSSRSSIFIDNERQKLKQLLESQLDDESRKVIERKLSKFPKQIDNGRWSRWLRGLRGVEGQVVTELDGLWPGTASVFEYGPPVNGNDLWQALYEDWHYDLFKRDLDQEDNPPLWAAMSGDKAKILAGFKAVESTSWISWTPSKLESNALYATSFDYDERDYEEYDLPKRMLNSYPDSPSSWSWWRPGEHHFSSHEALTDFLWSYINDYENIDPLLILTCMLSVQNYDFDKLDWEYRQKLKWKLKDHGLTLDEILSTIKLTTE